MSSPSNPYSPPTATVADIRDPSAPALFTTPGAKVGAGRGSAWISEGWQLFKAAPLLWIVALVIMVLVQVVVGLVPLVGSLANYLLYPVFMLGLLAFGKGVAENGQAEVGDLFLGFREKLGPLLMVGLLYLAMVIGLGLVFVGLLFAQAGSLPAFDAQGLEPWLAAAITEIGLDGFMLAFLVVMALAIPLGAALWFAPGLVFYADLGPGAAMKESLRSCLRNWLPFLVYGILAMFVVIGGTLALVIGLLVAVPVLMAAYYTSFADVFGKKA